MTTAALVVLAILMEQPPSPGAVSPYPTGVILEELPGRPGFQASGDRARSYVKETIARTVYGDDPAAPDGSPWLVLIGPDDETAHVESQIPDDLKTAIQVVRYTPNDPRLDRGFKQHYPGGTYAILMDGSRSITWKGLAAIADIIRQLNRLLGREPEPSPWDPVPWPSPGPDHEGVRSMMVYLSGVVTGWLTAGLFAVVLGVVVWVRRTLRSLDRALAQADKTPPSTQPSVSPPQPPASPNG